MESFSLHCSKKDFLYESEDGKRGAREMQVNHKATDTEEVRKCAPCIVYACESFISLK